MMRTVFTIAGIALAAAMLWFVRTPSPVGHRRNSEGYDRYAALYGQTLAGLPAPERVFDIRTDFGVVRAYRFAGAGAANAPLLLLPGRASAVQVWADNMPALLQIGDVYAFDLLGEPGMSIQSNRSRTMPTRPCGCIRRSRHYPKAGPTSSACPSAAGPQPIWHGTIPTTGDRDADRPGPGAGRHADGDGVALDTRLVSLHAEALA